MKNQIFKSALLSLTLAFLMTSDSFATSTTELITRLQSYKKDEIVKLMKSNPTAAGEQTQQMLLAIEESTKEALSQKKVDQKLICEILRASHLSFTNDPSEAAIEIIAPLFEKNKKATSSALKTLPVATQKELKKSLENLKREELKGNG